MAEEFPRPPEELAEAPSPRAVDTYAEAIQSFLIHTLNECTPEPRPRTRRPAKFWVDVEPEVKRCRRLHSIACTTRRPEDWATFRDAQAHKKRLITKARRDEFRQATAEACGREADMWRLARWARHRSHLPAAPPGIPPLARGDGSTATTTEEKEEVLVQAFFPEPDPHDLVEDDARAPPEVTIDQTVGDVSEALRKTISTSAPGPDGIPNMLLKALAPQIDWSLEALIKASWRCGHHPTAFRVSTTVAHRKPQKDDYSIAKAWRPIALLNTLGKANGEGPGREAPRCSRKTQPPPAVTDGGPPETLYGNSPRHPHRPDQRRKHLEGDSEHPSPRHLLHLR